MPQLLNSIRNGRKKVNQIHFVLFSLYIFKKNKHTRGSAAMLIDQLGIVGNIAYINDIKIKIYLSESLKIALNNKYIEKKPMKSDNAYIKTYAIYAEKK